MIGIVVSRADSASVNIGESLRALADFETVEDGVYRRPGFELREFDPLHLELDRIAEAFSDPEYVVVVSRHAGDTGPLLSAHFTGNFGDAEYGGTSRELAEACPGALHHVLASLDEHAPEEYDVSMECTHHGPTDLGAPGMFVELGSGEAEWNDPGGARAVAKSVLELEGVEPSAGRTLVAFGGNHYAPQPTRILRETAFGIGHVAADWSLEAMGDPTDARDLVAAMFEQSGAECAVVDGEYPDVEAVIASLGYRLVSERWVHETSGYDPDLVDDLEVALGPVEEGLRFGRVDAAAGSFLVIDLPTTLLEECQGIDRSATLAALEDWTVAYQTHENGNRAGDRAAIADRDDYATLIEACRAILEEAYDEVRREAGALLAERESFDPERAAAMGVPEGPKFGALAGGESVTVDGTTVEPADVRSRERRQFDV